MVKVEQVRAARGLLGWSQTQLSEASGLSLPTVRRFETGYAPVSEAAIESMRRALENAGVIFIGQNGDGPGVRLKKQHDG